MYTTLVHSTFPCPEEDSQWNPPHCPPQLASINRSPWHRSRPTRPPRRASKSVLAWVRAYAQAMSQQQSEGGLRFPAIVLFTDGQHYWLGDGFHRILAARAAGLTDFPADVRPGAQRDALLYSISSNAEHGLPRTNADKRKAVLLLLADAEWSQWSDGQIARRCQVSQVFVSKLRKGASHNGYEMQPRKV